MFRYFLIALFLYSFCSFGQIDSTAIARDSLQTLKFQDKKEEINSLSFVKDSSLYNTEKETLFFDSLETKLKRNKVTALICNYLLVCNNVDTSDLENNNFISEEKLYRKYEGKTIRSIRYQKVDIVEGNVYDTIQHIHSQASTFLDDIHYDTKNSVLRKNTILKTGEILDAYKVADNERILRNLSYITDVKTYIKSDPNDSNFVDLILVTQDRFSIGASAEPKDINQFDAELYEFNTLGTGNEIRYKSSFYNNKTRKLGHNTRIRFNNIFGLFIDGSVEYKLLDKREELNTVFIKEFLTPETKYVGGLRIYKTLGVYKKNIYAIPDSLEKELAFNRFNSDVWAGKVWQLKGYHHRNNIALSSRLYDMNYTRRPFTSLDSNIYFQDSKLYLARISLLRTTFIKTKKLYMFGVSEDLPIGFMSSITFGKEYREFKDRNYIGAQLLASNYIKKLGFISMNTQIGTFVRNNVAEDFTIKSTLRYFTKLHKIGRYDYRQFITLKYGLVRNLYSTTEFPNFTSDVRGLPSFIDYPKQNVILNFEPILFSPWNWIGFRFAFYGVYDLGFIAANTKNVLNHQNKYEAIGFGIRIRNDNLSFNIIQLRFVYYPQLPNGFSPYRVDYNSVTPRLYNDSELLKPTVVEYN